MYDSEKEYQMMFERLKDICKQRNITNYALAKATNLSNSSISNLMNGKTTPYVDTLLRICSAPDITIVELIGEDEKFNAEEMILIQNYRGMSQEKRQLLKIYIEILEAYKGKINM